VVSLHEGKQRQQNVRTAIAAVVEEQARQIRYNRRDAEKLRIVSLNHTNWSKDLAIASGESDADAVRCSFAEDRKSREFYLLKMAGKGQDSPKTQTVRRVPDFMKSPAVKNAVPSTASTTGAKLDAHTAAQISYRRAQQQHESSNKGDSASSITPSSSSGSLQDRQEPLRDSESSSSLAQRAKGFLTKDDGKMDMGAVMSGLGAIAAAAGSHETTSSSTAASATVSVSSNDSVGSATQQTLQAQTVSG
jgi:hypothetical protein